MKTRGYATPTCPKCGLAAGFEMQQGEVRNCNYKLWFVNCRSCGAVVHIFEHNNINERLEAFAAKLKVKLP
jgi:hypothetical protein